MVSMDARRTAAILFTTLVSLAAGFLVGQPPTLSRWYTNPDWWLVIVGGFSLLLLGIQMRATEKAAQAALLNAQAVIEAERPWLVVTVERNEAMGTPGWFSLRVTNKGNTPAQLIEAGIRHSFETNPQQLPIPPTYDPFLAPLTSLIPAEEGFTIRRTLSEESTGFNPGQMIQAYMTGPGPKYSGAVLVFYGLLVYDDVLGKKRPDYKSHETRWCLAFFPNGARWVRSGPGDAYNSYT